ncbi:hypothetical protein HK098_008023 [Nowakowskiella sp. JEL0407]|nr:hypothetical protein HK098_008023 [Nowakowskiella sp. JEL0407]
MYSNFPALPADPEPARVLVSPGSEKKNSPVVVPPRLSSAERLRKLAQQNSNSNPAAPASPILSAKPLQPPSFPLPPSPVLEDPISNPVKDVNTENNKPPSSVEKQGAVNMKRSKSERSRRTYKPLAPISPNVPSIPAPAQNTHVTAPVYSDDMDPLEFMDMLNDYLLNKPASSKPKHQRSRSTGSAKGVKLDIRASSYSNTSTSPTLTNASLPSSARSSYRQSPPEHVHLHHPQLVQQQQIPVGRKSQGFSENVLNLLQSLPDPNQKEVLPPRPHTPTSIMPPNMFQEDVPRGMSPFRSNSPHPMQQNIDINPKALIFENPQQHLQIQAKKRAQQLQNLSDFVKFPAPEPPSNLPKVAENSVKKEILEKKKEIDLKSKQAAALALSFR